jgi:hypothetical protein
MTYGKSIGAAIRDNATDLADKALYSMSLSNRKPADGDGDSSCHGSDIFHSGVQKRVRLLCFVVKRGI